MPYRMEITELTGNVTTSPVIAPNSNKSQFGYDDRKIEREINKTGKSMIRHGLIESFRVVDYIKEESLK